MPDAPPAIFVPPSAGSPPAAPGAVFAPPGAAGAPSAPAAVFVPPGAAGSPSAPPPVFSASSGGGSVTTPPGVFAPPAKVYPAGTVTVTGYTDPAMNGIFVVTGTLNSRYTYSNGLYQISYNGNMWVQRLIAAPNTLVGQTGATAVTTPNLAIWTSDIPGGGTATVSAPSVLAAPPAVFSY